MNSKHSLTLGLLALSAATTSLTAQALNVGGAGQPPASAAAAPSVVTNPTAPAAAATFTQTQVLETIGWVFGRQSQMDTFAFTPSEIEAVLRGVGLAAADRDPPVDLDAISPQLEVFVNERNEAYLARLRTLGQAETEAFFAQLRGQSGVTILPSGLGYEILRQGTGPMARPTDTVSAHYTGTLVNGEIFDASRDPSVPTTTVQPPVDIALAESIPGFLEGLQKINRGGRIKLYIPPSLAFGDEPGPGIPPASTLIFDVEVIDIRPTPGPASISTPAAP